MFTTLLAIAIVVGVITLTAIVMVKTAPPVVQAEPARLDLSHSINRTLCVGCEMCVVRCPVDVLALDEEHKATVVNPAACISCRLCEEVCPTPVKALRMYKPGLGAPEIQMPELDEYYQAVGTPGLYVIGEVAGKPLIKNGINLGLAAVAHIAGKRLPEGAAQPSPASVLDIVVIGAGPAGLSAGMACHEHRLSYVILERETSAMATVMSYPKGKDVHAAPPQLETLGPLWLPDKSCSKEELCERWNDKIDAVQLTIETGLEVSHVRASGGLFYVETARGRTFTAHNVIAAIGGRGTLPPLKLPTDRTQEVPGQNLPHIYRAPPEDPEQLRGQKILIVGGGNTAIEVAVGLARPGLKNKVFLSYHRPEIFLKANSDNLSAFRAAVHDGRILAFYEANPLSFSAGMTKMQLAERVRDVETDSVFILIGYDKPDRWLREIGVRFSTQRHDAFTLPDSAELARSLLRRCPQPPPPRPFCPQTRADREVTSEPPRQASSCQDTIIENQRPGAEQTDIPSEPLSVAEEPLATIIDNLATRIDGAHDESDKPTTPPRRELTMIQHAGHTIRIPRDAQLRRMPDKAILADALLQSATIRNLGEPK